VLFVFQLKDGEAKPVRPQGLDPAKDFRQHLRTRSPLPAARRLRSKGRRMLTGAELMEKGIVHALLERTGGVRHRSGSGRAVR
jgi:hypothetical protein